MTMPSSSGERNQTNERIDEEGKRWRHRHWHNHNAHRIGVASAYDNFVGVWSWTRNQRLFGDNAVPGCVILLLIILCYTGARVRRHRARSTHRWVYTRMMNWWKSQLQTFQLRPRQLRRQVPRRRHWLGRNWQKNYQLFNMCVTVDADNVDIKTQIWLVVPTAIKCQVSDDYLTMSSSISIRSVSPTTTIRSQALQKRYVLQWSDSWIIHTFLKDWLRCVRTEKTVDMKQTKLLESREPERCYELYLTNNIDTQI